MAAKYLRLKLKGKRSMAEIQSAVGRSGGTMLRVHVENEETDVYFAAGSAAAADVAKAMKSSAEPNEVDLADVTKLG